MTNETNKLEILVVDDKAENIAAAKAALDGKASLDIATNYDEAIKAIKEKSYAGAILDIEFPRNQGAVPAKLGLKLGKNLRNYAIPHIYLTGLTCSESHGGDHSRICLTEEIAESPWNGIQASKKSNPDTWLQAYKELNEFYPNIKEVYESKKRFKKAVGKNYQMKGGK